MFGFELGLDMDGDDAAFDNFLQASLDPIAQIMG
jgi:hypothetical protein